MYPSLGTPDLKQHCDKSIFCSLTIREKIHICKTDRAKAYPLMIKLLNRPFTSRVCNDRKRHLFGYNATAAVSRELFKPSTDAASLLVSI